MARKFKELLDKMPPEAKAEVKARAKKLLAELPLEELREARQITQEHLAETMHISQVAVSRMERRADLYLSSLQRIVVAMGGKLEILATFPDGSIRISRIGELDL